MVGHFFEPDEKICLVFSNEHYDKLRERPEFAKTWGDDGRDSLIRELGLNDELQYADIPRAREWADNFEEGIKAYGFSDDQVKRYNDTDKDTMGSALMEVVAKIKQNASQGRRTLLLCFYAGHGATKEGITWALFNSNLKFELPLEYGLRYILAREKGCYLISFFACGRIKMPEEAKRGGADTEVTAPRPIEDAGQGIYIYAASDGMPIMPDK